MVHEIVQLDAIQRRSAIEPGKLAIHMVEQIPKLQQQGTR
jgi:hypothetical protein